MVFAWIAGAGYRVFEAVAGGKRLRRARDVGAVQQRAAVNPPAGPGIDVKLETEGHAATGPVAQVFAPASIPRAKIRGHFVRVVANHTLHLAGEVVSRRKAIPSRGESLRGFRGSEPEDCDTKHGELARHGRLLFRRHPGCMLPHNEMNGSDGAHAPRVTAVTPGGSARFTMAPVREREFFAVVSAVRLRTLIEFLGVGRRRRARRIRVQMRAVAPKGIRRG